MMMNHHGINVIGPNAAEALEDLYYFERSARLNVEIRNMGQDPAKCSMSNEQAENFYQQVQSYPDRTRTADALFLAWKESGI